MEDHDGVSLPPPNHGNSTLDKELKHKAVFPLVYDGHFSVKPTFYSLNRRSFLLNVSHDIEVTDNCDGENDETQNQEKKSNEKFDFDPLFFNYEKLTLINEWQGHGSTDHSYQNTNKPCICSRYIVREQFKEGENG